MRVIDTIDHPRKRDLLEILDESQPATISELATVLGEHPITVERHCNSLQRDGYVCQCTSGTYRLSERLTADDSVTPPTAAD